MLTSFFIHRVFAILFLFIIPLPFIALMKIRKQTALRSAVIWQYIIRVTNISLVAILITGIAIYPIYSSIRFWVAVGLTLIVGGLLGVISKELKRYNMKSDQGSQVAHLKRISILGFSYVGVIIVIFGFMAHFYQL